MPYEVRSNWLGFPVKEFSSKGNAIQYAIKTSRKYPDIRVEILHTRYSSYGDIEVIMKDGKFLKG